MILAEAPLTEVLAAFAFEIDRGGVEEDELQFAEEVPPVGELPLLDPVLGAAGCEGRPSRLLVVGQLFAEPEHCPVEVVQLQRLAAVDLVVVLPRLGGPVAARCEEAMEHGQENSPLHIELEAASAQESLDDLLASGLLPEPLKDQGWADPSGSNGGEVPLGMGREQQNGPGEPSTRGQ